MYSISLIFDHHRRTPKGDEGPVEVRVTINRKPIYIQTGVRVREDRLIGNAVHDVPIVCRDGKERMTQDADLLNERLTTIVGLIEKEVNRCLEERRPLDVATIRKNIWSMSPENKESDNDVPTLITWIKETASEADITKATKKRYTTLTNCLEDFGKILRWEDLTIDNIYAWDVWLRQKPVPLTENQKVKGITEQTMKQSAVYNYHKLLKAMLNRALKFGKINVNPYDRMKGVFKKGSRDVVEYLTEEQMKKIMEITPVSGSQVETARDLFVFQMFTGLSYIDTQQFDIGAYRKVKGRDDVTGERTERWEYTGQRIKTGVPYVSQLLPPVVEVLEKHGWKVPRMNNQRYNQMLKCIGMVIGIPNLHSHMGRHTFATWMLSQGVKIENVSRMLGHTNIVQTQRYAQVLAKDVHDEYDMVARKMKSKE